MNAALFFLFTRSFVNSGRVKLRRLREPKYLLGLFGGLVWMVWTMGAFFIPRGRGGAHLFSFAAESAAMPAAFAFTLLAMLGGWILPSSRGALNLDENEAAWLFASPLSRRTLFAWHFFKPQWGIFILAVFGSIAWHQTTRQPLGPACLAIWLIFNVLSLHNFATGILRTSIEKQLWLTRLLKGLACLVALGLLVAAGEIFRESLAGRVAPLQTPSAFWLTSTGLRPVVSLLSPLWAGSWTAVLLRSGPLAALGLGCWFFIARSRHPVVESTLDAIVVRQERLAAFRAGRITLKKPRAQSASAELFSLSGPGPAWMAFLWKWGLHTGGRRRVIKRFILITTALSLVVTGVLLTDRVVFAKAHGDMIVLGVCLYIGVLLPGLFVAPARITQQLRIDLDHLDILLTLPVRPSRMLAGLLLGPLLQVVLSSWLVLSTIALVMLLRPTFPQLTPAVVLAGWAGACLATAAVIPTATIMQTLIALTFPGWQPAQRRASVDNMGIGLLALILIFASLTLTLGLSALICFGGWWLLRDHIVMPVAVLAAGLITTLVATAEGWLAFRLAARMLWRYDPSEKTAGVRKKR